MSPWGGGHDPAAPVGQLTHTLLTSVLRDVLPMAMVGRVWAHTDTKGSNLSGQSSMAARHMGGLAPPWLGEEQCMPWASPVPCLGGVTHYLQAEQHRGLLSAATSPLGAPTLGAAIGWQRKEDARHRGSAPLQQPGVPVALLQDPQNKGWSWGHCLQMKVLLTPSPSCAPCL